MYSGTRIDVTIALQMSIEEDDEDSSEVQG
jgi:hypothetical protein